ncbi:DUF6804 family protein [Pedobacter namyangjuensis]|uniref:DUF6804 family protein n=1 Tax=Pedobacter namyangjuensis TaxID=600626 RepID=UPI000DE220D3|nr:DUF6804 family protein [Pedobacter namyangjuensis]
MSNIIKITLSILLLLCLLQMPYGYYQLVRFVAMVGFGVLAFQAHKKEHQLEMVICALLALLFQPFAKVALGKELWNVVDVIVALALLISMFTKPYNERLERIKKEQNHSDRNFPDHK